MPAKNPLAPVLSTFAKFAKFAIFAIFAIFANFADFAPFIRTPGPGRQDSWMPWPILPLNAAIKRPYHPESLHVAGGISSGKHFMTTSVCARAMIRCCCMIGAVLRT